MNEFTSMNLKQSSRDIVRFAAEEMGIMLTTTQVEIIDALANGKSILIRRKMGYSTAQRVLQAYVESSNGYVKHWDKTHFTAVTIGGRKFVYCPVGNICSWSEGDYDNKWCHWCKKHFEEIK